MSSGSARLCLAFSHDCLLVFVTQFYQMPEYGFRARTISARLFHIVCSLLCLFTVTLTGLFFFYRWSVTSTLSPHYMEKAFVAILTSMAIFGWVWGIAHPRARCRVVHASAVCRNCFILLYP